MTDEQDELGEFRELDEDEPGELSETIEQQVESYRKALQVSNEYASHLERELHARGGPAPRFADLVEAQRDGTVDEWRNGGLLTYTAGPVKVPVIVTALTPEAQAELDAMPGGRVVALTRENAFALVERELRAIEARVDTGDHDMGGETVWDPELEPQSLFDAISAWKLR
jgi:hypothetical protein